MENKNVNRALTALNGMTEEEVTLVLRNTYNVFEQEFLAYRSGATDAGITLSHGLSNICYDGSNLMSDPDPRVTMTTVSLADTIIRRWDKLLHRGIAIEIADHVRIVGTDEQDYLNWVHRKLTSESLWFAYFLTIATAKGWLSEGVSRRLRLYNCIPHTEYEALQDLAEQAGLERAWVRSTRNSSVFSQAIIITDTLVDVNSLPGCHTVESILDAFIGDVFSAYEDALDTVWSNVQCDKMNTVTLCEFLQKLETAMGVQDNA